MSHLEQQFADLWLDLYPDVDLHSEYRFHPHRRFRFDFAYLESKVAVEIQGAIWVSGTGHNSGTGLIRDYEKLCLASSEGWRVFMLAESMITRHWLNLIAVAINPELKKPEACQQLTLL